MKLLRQNSSNNQVLIESLENQYKTIITDGCAQHSTQTTTTHNWPLDTQTTPVGHRLETIATEVQSMTAEDIINDGQIETDTGSDGCVDTNTETIHIVNENEIKEEKEDTDWSPLSVMKYSMYNKPKRQRVQHKARKSCVSSPPKTSIYICNLMGCVDTYITKTLLDNHRKVNHKIDVPFGAQQLVVKTDPQSSSSLKPFACNYENCNFRAVNQLLLNKHLESHDRANHQFFCDYDDCGRSFAHKRAFKIHQRSSGHFDDTDDMAIPGPPYGCQRRNCKKAFTTLWKLKRHVDQVHDGVRPFACHDCPQRFQSCSSLRIHRLQKHSLEPKVFKCDFIGCEFETNVSNSLDQHKKRHLNIKKFVCEETDCAMSFISKADLKRHMRSHSDERPHRCDWPGCESAYKRADLLADHRRRHTGDLPFVCDECQRRFPSKNTLNAHNRDIHINGTDNKRFKCDVSGCSWVTNKPFFLKVHRRTHQNLRPFVCKETDCGKSFNLKSTLTKHMRCHSDERPFRCDWPACESAYKSSKGLADHRRTHTGEREF
ncbi:unnamed protein product, partial [Medioppia subpectinata]